MLVVLILEDYENDKFLQQNNKLRKEMKRKKKITNTFHLFRVDMTVFSIHIYENMRYIICGEISF
jgi:hypothetical protein